EEIYPAASKACKEDEARHERAKQATVELQNKRPGYFALWKHFLSVSIESMKTNFGALNVHFDLWNGEASVHDLIEPMAEKLKASSHAIEDDGALVIPVQKNDDKKEMPPLILYKKDGAVMYGTTDLATLVERMDLYNPSKIVYVVDHRQHLHFEQVFRASRLSGIVPQSTALNYVGYGTMNGTDGKPFKTRAGGVMKLDDLLSMGREKALARLEEAKIGNDFSEDEKLDIATKIGLSAIKFADLQNNPVTDYVFDLDRMTSFEGKTGPYILYQAVRIKSLLRKAEAQGDIIGDIINVSDSNKALVLLMSELSNVLEGTCRHYSPHILADYIYNLAQAFSSFYNSCHILSEENAGVKASHLALCQLVSDQLETCMGLLGVDIPERM
ncbi:MAG: arginine--tRNA ligase, partial [Bdellovibrionales bacterium]